MNQRCEYPEKLKGKMLLDVSPANPPNLVEKEQKQN